MIRYASFFFVAVNTLFATIGILHSDAPNLFWIPLAIGLTWGGVLFRRWQQLSDLFLIFSVLLAVVILMNNGSIYWAVFGYFSAITAWDLGRFDAYLLSVDHINGKKQIIINHLASFFILNTSALAIVLSVSQVTLNLNLVVISGFIFLLLFTFNKKH